MSATQPNNGPVSALWLTSGQQYQQYALTGDIKYLTNAINSLTEAAQIPAEDGPTQAALILRNLGWLLWTRYSREWDMKDLDAAIEQTGGACAITPQGHPSLAGMWGNLGAYHGERYDRSGSMQDLEAAITHGEAALEAGPKNHPDRPAWLGSLGTYYSHRFHHAANLHDLEAAIEHTVTAVNSTPPHHPRYAALLSNLANRLGSRYERLGNVQDLDTAIDHAKVAVEATPHGHPRFAGTLHNLATLHGRRFQRIGNILDLEAAITHTEAAIQTTPTDHPDQALMRGNLAGYYGYRYNRTKNIQDSDDAVGYGVAALKATSPGQPTFGGYLTNIASFLSDRSDNTGDAEALGMAIQYAEEASKAMSADHPERAGVENNLANYLRSRFEQSRDVEDLTTAISHMEAAVSATPPNHPHMAGMLNNLGALLLSPALPDSQKNHVRALAAFQGAWGCSHSPILQRLTAALAAARILVYSDTVTVDLQAAHEILTGAVQLLPLASARSLARDDQQYILQQLAGLPSLTAAVCLELEQPIEAVRMLEMGRDVTNGQLLNYRIDISDLALRHPPLAERFESLRQELDSPFHPSTIDVAGITSAINRRVQLAKDFEDTLQQIREQAGFENFQLPPTRETLQAAAHFGPIVILNTTQLCSHAIIVIQDDIRSIALPKLSLSDVVLKLHSVYNISDDIGAWNQSTKKVLSWLWDAAVEPVLQELDIFSVEGQFPTQSALPRIWWIGVGPMARAPIHAAGKYGRARRRRNTEICTLDYCIPLYTPTIRALMHSRTQNSKNHNDNKTADAYSALDTLIVAMPTTPGLQKLPGVEKEVESITSAFTRVAGGHSPKIEILRKPTTERVLSELEKCGIVHFACHGMSEMNPADSYLALLDSSATPADEGQSEQVGQLRVRAVVAKRLQLGRLAFLSACRSAENRDQALADEITHIASSFHIAGFSHVIGTLWLADNEACILMTREFYSSLLEKDDAVLAYHHAIKVVRDAHVDDFFAWAPFVHMGG